MPPPDQRTDRFRYVGSAVDPDRGEVRCTYATGEHTFTETFTFGPGRRWDDPAVEAAVRLLFLVTGVSYYKTTAAPVIDLGETATTADERTFLHDFYVHGLGEFAYRNGIDLRDLRIEGPDASPGPPAPYDPAAGRPLIPFGGGIDSIVTVDALREPPHQATLCIVHPPGDSFAAIEDAAAVTGLPIVRVARQLSPLVRRSAELGFLNGHVPVTAIISAAALVAAVLGGHDAVVLSNEWSASAPTLVHDGVPINHQWSKGASFEQRFSQVVHGALGPRVDVFSYLRPRSELWVAEQFARLPAFHGVFRSCNRAFHQDPAQRLDHWCGVCDKCCFIDLILAPFMSAAALNAVFGGAEPLKDPALEDRFATLLDLGAGDKPFECVGDTGECRAAVILAAERADRAGTALLDKLRSAVVAADATSSAPRHLLDPMGSHSIPDRYVPADLLVRAR